MRFLLSCAVEKALPGATLSGGQPVGGSYLFKLSSNDDKFDVSAAIATLGSQINELIDAGLPIVQKSVRSEAVSKYFNANGQPVAAKLVSKRTASEFRVHCLGDSMRLQHFNLCTNTSQLSGAKGEYVLAAVGKDGEFTLSMSKDTKPQPMLLSSIRDIRQWGQAMRVTSVADLDSLEVVGRGRKDFALQSEFRQDMKIAEIVSKISSSKTEIKLICIAGPTSSGKTTFATKLSMYLSNIGRPATPLTVDHYYRPLAEQPDMIKYNDRTKVDYDSIRSMDIELVQEHLAALVNGKQVMTPEYSFHTGNRVPPGHPLKLAPRGILVIEGIHALNPEYTKSVPRGNVFKIFLSPITQMQLDDFNTLKSTHSRLLRRMSRDYLFRSHSASHTLRMWSNVRRGEGRWIFPFQNDVDYICNSALEYELGVLKVQTAPLLRGVPTTDANYHIVEELLAILNQVHAWDSTVVPATSLLREFLGGGVFDKH